MKLWRSSLVAAGFAVVLMTLAAAALTAVGATEAAVRPVIGRPTAVPLQPLAGRRFTVTFKVTRSDTGQPLARGRMSCLPSVAGRTVQHVESFRDGAARVQLVVPASAGGRLLTVKVTITSGGRSATRVAAFRVLQEGLPALSIADAWVGEGNAGAAKLVFDVTLSRPSPMTVRVGYATSDGTATQPGDYTAASGQLTFAPGETAKTIEVGVVGDRAVEPDENLMVTLSSPENASIAISTATGTITNDDTGAAVTPGQYKGATQEGNYVFFTVLADRRIERFRVNALPCRCRPGGAWLEGVEDLGETVIPIRPNGTFSIEDTWTGSEREGDLEWTTRYVKLTGSFPTASTAKGTIAARYEFNKGGVHYVCNSWTKTWTAALQG